MTYEPDSLDLHNTLLWSARTDRGKVRKNNEDAFLGVRIDGQEVQLLGKTGLAHVGCAQFVFAVSDGMGGALAGEYASRIAVDKITRLLPRWSLATNSELEGQHPSILTGLFVEVHRALQYLGASYEECGGMEATLTMCWFAGNRMYHGHLGDSRLYQLSGKTGGFQQLTEDDTHVGWLYRTGQINEREARNHPRRRVLQKALGGGNQFVTPQVGSVAWTPGDQFLLCTDGVVEELYDAELVDLLRSTKRDDKSEADRVIDAVLAKAAGDNATAVVIEVGDQKTGD